jgi:hypothetical protein
MPHMTYEEALTYGLHFSSAASVLAPSTHPFLGDVGREVERETQALSKVLSQVRQGRKGRRQSSSAKKDLLPKIQRAFTEANFWLRAHRAEVDGKDVFPNGREGARGGSADVVLLAAKTCAAGFARYSHVPGAKQRQATFEKLARQLAEVLDESKSAGRELTETHPSLVAAHERWLEVYGAAKHIARGIFKLKRSKAQVSGLMKQAFADLAVRGKRKTASQTAQPAQAQPESVTETA